jgi:hypothetical protein
LATTYWWWKKLWSTWFIGNAYLHFHVLEQYSIHLTPFPCCKYFSHVFFVKKAICILLLLLRIWCDPKAKNTMYRKDLLKEWSSGYLASWGWYLYCLVDSTLKLDYGLKEKFEGACLDKPTLSYSCLRGGKRSHSAKKLKKTKDQLVGL